MAAQGEDKKLLQRSQLRQHGEFWHVSVSERQRSRPCGQNLRVPFLRTVLPPEVEESARAMVANGETKAFISLPPTVVSPTEKSREFICLATSSFPANGGRLARRCARERTCRAVTFRWRKQAIYGSYKKLDPCSTQRRAIWSGHWKFLGGKHG